MMIPHRLPTRIIAFLRRAVGGSARGASGGSVALYLVMITSLLLMTTTMLGARLSVSEVRQSSDIDQSNGAYYAAEAGVEEASRRLDINEDQHAELKEIFPEQYDGDDLHGDRAVLVDSEGERDIGGSFDIEHDNRSEHGDIKGRLAWRQRRVYEEPRTPHGTLVKDETVELDATGLRRECPGQEDYAGKDGKDCDGQDIFTRLDAIQLCWTDPADKDVHMEFTVLSYPKNSPERVDTDKYISEGGGGFETGDHSRLEHASESRRETCAEIRGKSGDLNSSRRYIVRVRPLFPNLDPPEEGRDAAEHTVDYRTKLIDESSGQPNPLFIPDNTVLIDVVGQSGDVRRRIIARKQRQGRILGIFDYVLYSGSDNLPLCKVGVQQSDVGYDTEDDCRVKRGS